MANSLQNMRRRRGYRGLLRGNPSMLGRIQIRDLHRATFLHGISVHWVGFIIWAAIILFLVDSIVRDELDGQPFSSSGLGFFILILVLELVFILVAAITHHRILRSDPCRVAHEDVERILVDVRDSRGRRATVDRIAGSNEAEFLCDFYKIRSFRWLGVITLVIMLGALIGSFMVHIQFYQAQHNKIVASYLEAEQKAVEALQRANLCDDINASDEYDTYRTLHHAECSITLEDETEFVFTVNFNEDYQIDELSFKYTIDRNIVDEIPNIEQINDYIIILETSIYTIRDMAADPDILTYYYMIDEDFLDNLHRNGYENGYSIFRDAIPGDEKCNHNVYISYSYYTLTSTDEPKNYIYISSH